MTFLHHKIGIKSPIKCSSSDNCCSNTDGCLSERKAGEYLNTNIDSQFKSVLFLHKHSITLEIVSARTISLCGTYFFGVYFKNHKNAHKLMKWPLKIFIIHLFLGIAVIKSKLWRYFLVHWILVWLKISFPQTIYPITHFRAGNFSTSDQLWCRISMVTHSIFANITGQRRHSKSLGRVFNVPKI